MFCLKEEVWDEGSKQPHDQNTVNAARQVKAARKYTSFFTNSIKIIVKC